MKRRRNYRYHDLATTARHGLLPRLDGTTTKFLRGDGTWAAVSGSGASGTIVEKNLGSSPAWRGSFTITDAGIDGTKKVMVWQAPGPYTGKGTRADEAEMQAVNVVCVEPAAGSCIVKWQTPPMVTQRKVVDDPGMFEAIGATYDRASNQRWPEEYTPIRLGKVRGNVKFVYMILT